jgi:hypothetical protein
MIYSDYPGLLFGFHGCHKEVYKDVIRKSRPLLPSNNSYDWLGGGIYFWENSYYRALDWARSHYADDDDWLIRDLDCAVINQIHIVNEQLNQRPFDSVRGIFTEGKPIYPGAGFRGKTHVQLCIRSIACIKGYFAPRDDEGNAIKY